MKYLLLIVFALALLWWWRTIGRKSIGEPEDKRERAPAKSPAPPQDMVACRQCGLHLPRAEAVAGAQGLYCSEKHHRASESS